jgi:phosphotransacetylase
LSDLVYVRNAALRTHLGKAKAIGSILFGTGAQIPVLQTRDEVDAIVQIAAVAAMDSMDRKWDPRFQ